MNRKTVVFIKSAIFAIGFLGGWGFIALVLRKLDTFISFKLPRELEPIAILLMIAGVSLAFLCVYLFAVRGEGTPAPFDPPVKFVAIGPYRYTRNPMYIGGLSLLTGFALFLNSPTVLLLVPILALAFHLFVVYYEEPNLERRFGESYLKYKAEVGRWLPRFVRK
jgi:protein-S-isoprenylcysteine O-methyltransferase Ste14